MNRETDRIPVPTNGHTPRASRRKTSAAAKTQAVVTAPPPPPVRLPGPVARVTSPEPTVSVTPAQVAVGFGMIAGIILLALGRRRGRGKR